MGILDVLRGDRRGAFIILVDIGGDFGLDFLFEHSLRERYTSFFGRRAGPPVEWLLCGCHRGARCRACIGVVACVFYFYGNFWRGCCWGVALFWRGAAFIRVWCWVLCGFLMGGQGRAGVGPRCGVVSLVLVIVLLLSFATYDGASRTCVCLRLSAVPRALSPRVTGASVRLLVDRGVCRKLVQFSGAKGLIYTITRDCRGRKLACAFGVQGSTG